jgi:hypothetical protein
MPEAEGGMSEEFLSGLRKRSLKSKQTAKKHQTSHHPQNLLSGY